MENNVKKILPIYIALLAMPMVASIGLLANRQYGRYLPSQIGRIRTEAEQRDLRRENLEDTIDDFRMNYKSFMEVVGFKRTLPTEYDNWKVSVDVNDNWINHGRQSAVDYSEDGLGKVVQINLSEQDAQKIIERLRR